MKFVSLRVINLRCFGELDYRPGPATNLIYGPNGSGKTSLLEALHIATIGKSFLTGRLSDLTTAGADGFSIAAEVNSAKSSGCSTIAVRKRKAETEILLDGQPVTTASHLARDLPVLVINSGAPDLLAEAPNNRRALLDKPMFHVEPGYIHLWKEYRQALRQRNELLRHRHTRAEAIYWEQRLATSGEKITEGRRSVIVALNSSLETVSLPGLCDGDLQFEFSPGWDVQRSLVDQLAQDWERDADLGYTVAGPHRADLALRSNGRAVSRKLSRGQSKIIVCLSVVAIAHFMKSRGVEPVLLIDDLAAEMDDTMRGFAVDAIHSVGAQCFFTAIKAAELENFLPAAKSMFHVERNERRSKTA